MTRAEAYFTVMKKWPQYKIDDIAELTTQQINALMNEEEDTVTFRSMEEYSQWLAKTKS